MRWLRLAVSGAARGRRVSGSPPPRQRIPAHVVRAAHRGGDGERCGVARWRIHGAGEPHAPVRHPGRAARHGGAWSLRRACGVGLRTPQADVRAAGRRPRVHETGSWPVVTRFVAQQGHQPRTTFQLAIVRRSDGRVIGHCGIGKHTASMCEAEIGYELAPHAWGQGYATEAARALVGFGFAELDIHRIAARCVADNVASARVLEKLGMRREGRVRGHEWFQGRWWDTLIYGLLEADWRRRGT